MGLQQSKISDWLVKARQHFHMNPEVSHEEVGTKKEIIGILSDLGIETKEFNGLIGAVGLIRGLK